MPDIFVIGLVEHHHHMIGHAHINAATSALVAMVPVGLFGLHTNRRARLVGDGRCRVAGKSVNQFFCDASTATVRGLHLHLVMTKVCSAITASSPGDKGSRKPSRFRPSRFRE